MNKNILIAGGAGFIGSHLCERFLKGGENVICVDNLSTSSGKNVLKFLRHNNFKFIKADVTNKINDISDLNIKFHKIYNLACAASPDFYQKEPIVTLKTSIDGSQNLLELARKNRSKYFYSSTSEVYGDPQEYPQKETYFGNVNPIGKRACYDEGKRVGECLAADYSKLYNIEVRIARIFNTYGPRMLERDGRVVSNFICQALTGNPITIYGKGDQTRSFCFIDDLLDGIQSLMDENVHYNSPVNLGNNYELSINQFAEKIVTLTNSNSKLIYKSLPEDDPKRRCPDLSLARKLLSYEPKISLHSGLSTTIKYFKKVIASPLSYELSEHDNVVLNSNNIKVDSLESQTFEEYRSIY